MRCPQLPLYCPSLVRPTSMVQGVMNMCTGATMAPRRGPPSVPRRGLSMRCDSRQWSFHPPGTLHGDVYTTLFSKHKATMRSRYVKQTEDDPFHGLMPSRSFGQDYEFSCREDSTFSLEEDFSNDFLDGSDLFTKHSVFRDTSENSSYEADVSEAALDLEWQQLAEMSPPVMSRPRVCNNAQIQSPNSRPRSRGRTRVRRLSVTPAADTAPPEARATPTMAASKRKTAAALSAKAKSQCVVPDCHLQPFKKDSIGGNYHGARDLNAPFGGTRRTSNPPRQRATLTTIPVLDQTRDRSQGRNRPTRLRMLIGSIANEADIHQSEGETNRNTTGRKSRLKPLGKTVPCGLSKSLHSGKDNDGTSSELHRKRSKSPLTTRSRGLSKSQHSKIDHGSGISSTTQSTKSIRLLVKSLPHGELLKARSHGCNDFPRTSRRQSTDSDASTVTHTMSNSSDGGSSSASSSFTKIYIKRDMDKHFGEQSTDEDIFPSRLILKGKPQAAVESARHFGDKNGFIRCRLVKASRPAQENLNASNTGINRSRHTSPDSARDTIGSTVLGGRKDRELFHQDLRPKAPTRKKSLDYEDHLTLREKLKSKHPLTSKSVH